MSTGEPTLEVTVDGTSVVGPVTLDQIRRGIAAGRVPRNAYARHRGTTNWVPLSAFLHAGAAPAPAHGTPTHPAPPVVQHHPQAPTWQQQPAAPPNVHGIQWHQGASAIAPGGYDPQVAAASAHLAQLQHQVRQVADHLAALRGQLESVEEAIEIQSFGFYRAKYAFGSAEEYADRLRDIRDDQKFAIKMGDATRCTTTWTVDGSAAEGRRMIAKQSKLMLRAFNGECDAAIAKARYDNVLKLEQRIHKSYDDINKLGESNQVTIAVEYLNLKLAELHLVHEHREKVQEEKEEQRRIREQLREEERALQEIERAQDQAQKEEDRYAKALAKAQADLAEATGRQHEKLEALVTKLEIELKDAIDRKAKAIARAQLTRSGHVYVLSNVGSFGEGVYKIGMTRRFEPLERVDELGDASVPFPFDVHAIIYCEDAPALETKLHRAFDGRRVNAVNSRKEYFRVTLDEIRAEIARHHGLVTFVLEAEAEQYRKTVAARLPAGSDPGPAVHT